MLQHGAMYGPCVLEDHEYYRLLTSMFMHFGINHIVNNMLVLFVLGDNLERALGKVKYLLFPVQSFPEDQDGPAEERRLPVSLVA